MDLTLFQQDRKEVIDMANSLEKFAGKNVSIVLNSGEKLKAYVVDYMNAEDFDEQYDSIAIKVQEVIKENLSGTKLESFKSTDTLVALYENEIIGIEVLQ